MEGVKGLLRNLSRSLFGPILYGPCSIDTPSETPDPVEESEPVPQSYTLDLDVYEVTVEYRNGDVETFETYLTSLRRDHEVSFKVEPKTRRSYNRGSPSIEYTRRPISFEVLARDPIEEHIATETWKVSYTGFADDAESYARGSEELERIDRVEVVE